MYSMATRRNRNRRKSRRYRRGGNFVTQFMRNKLGINAGVSTSKAADDIMKATSDDEIKGILNQEGLNIDNVRRDLNNKGADWNLKLKLEELKPRTQLNPLPSHLDYERPIPESKSYIPSLME
jgi:hypothetical protein